MKTRYILQILILGAVLLALALPVYADDLNNSVAAFMRMGVGSRIIAMGEAGSTVSNDIVSGYWNPSGLTYLKDIEVGTMYNFSMGYDRRHTYAAVGKNFGFGALAFSWINAGVGDIDGYDEDGDPTGTFSDEEHSFALSYARNFDRFSIGLSPKFYYSSIAGESDTGFGVDLGAHYDVNQYLEVGLMGRDLYGKYGPETVPYEISAGLAVFPILGVTLAADLKLEKTENPYVCFGAEYWTSIGRDREAGSQLDDIAISEQGTWSDILSEFETGLRLGYNQGRLSAGTGVKFRNFQLDYVFRFNDHDIFADDHIISLILRF
ncbi:MAG TPA: PorV/PorQ family protein [Candidatus Syntrophosphaera sp.]|jgi:hypothetical protein|nr:PorV/PorQ family protein [Candidatus Syntrophosphaera sp.]